MPDISGIATNAGEIETLKSELNNISTTVSEHTSTIDTHTSDIETNADDIAELQETVGSIVADDYTLTLQKDGTSQNTEVDIINFIGEGVTVTNKGGSRVEVNIPGGGGSGGSSTVASAAVVQSDFDRSSERADKQQFHLNGGSEGW